MAGIGLLLRKLTDKNTFLGFIGAHLYAGVLSGGAWVLAIALLVAIYFFIAQPLGHPLSGIQFLVAVTYLVSSSLIISGFFQYCLTRYIADLIFQKRENKIVAAFFTAILVMMIISLILGFGFVLLFLPEEALSIKVIMLSCFVLMNMIWLFSNTLSGLKNYHFILFSFMSAYIIIVILAYFLSHWQLSGFLLAFYLGQVVLVLAFFVFILQSYPLKRLINLELFHFMKLNPALIWGGVFFYLSVWVDKYCFWFNKETSSAVLGGLRGSAIYDMPIFIAFILMVPGMAMFFYEMEANFSRYYDYYYDAIREGATLWEIDKKHHELVVMARNCLLNTMKVQVTVAGIGLLFAADMLRVLKLSPIYVFILRIDIVAVSLLTLLLGQLNILYYLNKVRDVCVISSIFLGLNLILTLISFRLGPLYFGYGFALSLLLANLVAALILRRAFQQLTYYAFMSI